MESLSGVGFRHDSCKDTIMLNFTVRVAEQR
jgi:hypothetical protein